MLIINLLLLSFVTQKTRKKRVNHLKINQIIWKGVYIFSTRTSSWMLKDTRWYLLRSLEFIQIRQKFYITYIQPGLHRNSQAGENTLPLPSGPASITRLVLDHLEHSNCNLKCISNQKYEVHSEQQAGTPYAEDSKFLWSLNVSYISANVPSVA